MSDITNVRRTLFLTAGLLLCAGAAAAQAAAPKTAPSEPPSWETSARGSFLFRPCRSGRRLSLCLGGEDDAPSAFAARFDRLTRLAGMFMGRVQAATLCGMRLRLKLDIL